MFFKYTYLLKLLTVFLAAGMFAFSAGAEEGGHEHHDDLPWYRKYVFSTDHKVISKQFMLASLIFLFIGVREFGLLGAIIGQPLGSSREPTRARKVWSPVARAHSSAN